MSGGGGESEETERLRDSPRKMTAAAVTSTKYSPMLEYSSHICVFWFITVGFVVLISTLPTTIHIQPP